MIKIQKFEDGGLVSKGESLFIPHDEGDELVCMIGKKVIPCTNGRIVDSLAEAVKSKVKSLLESETLNALAGSEK